MCHKRLVQAIILDLLGSLVDFHKLPHLVLQLFDLTVLISDPCLVCFLFVNELLLDFGRFLEVWLSWDVIILGHFSYLSFAVLASLSLLLIGLFIFENLTLAFVNNLEEEVFHQAETLLVLFGYLNLYKVIVTSTYTFQLFLEGLRVL